MSPRLPGKPDPTVSASHAGTWIALFFSVGIVGGLISLVSLIFPDILVLAVLAGGFCGLVAIHYFTWGRWLLRHHATLSTQNKAKASAPPIEEESGPTGSIAE